MTTALNDMDMQTGHSTSGISARDKRFGRDIAFGIQQTLACWATDFIDPYVSKWYQNKYGNKAHEVTHAHTWGGEIVGDSAAFFVFIAAKRLLGKPIDGVTHMVRTTCKPLLEAMGRRAIAPWAKEAHVAEADERYRKKLAYYTQFQAENIVDTGIIATAATALNVGAQRYMFGNKQGMGLILTSKLIGAAATVSVMLGLRTAMPTTMKSLDDELSERYFSKVVHGAKRVMGVADVEAEAGSEPIPEATLPPDKERQMIAMVRSHAASLKLSEKPDILRLERNIIDAMVDIFDPEGAFAERMTEEYQRMLAAVYQRAAEGKKAKEFAAMDVARESVASILRNRRHDLALFHNSLSQPHTLDALMQDGEPYVMTAKLSDEKKESLIASLLQQKESGHGEPAVHIYANAKGQVLEHQALGYLFNPEGKLASLFTEELQSRLPNLPQNALEHIAKNYMADREAAAIRATLAFAMDGEVVSEAVKRSKALQEQASASLSPATSL